MDGKTEKATPKKRQDERKRGNVFSSTDVVNIATLLATFLTLKFYFPIITDRLTEIVLEFVSYAATLERPTADMIHHMLFEGIVAFVLIVMPVAVAAMATGVVAMGVQTRFLFSKENLKPKFNRLSPMQGFKRMFSMRSFVEVLKGTVKIAVILYLLYSFFTKSLTTFALIMNMELTEAVTVILDLVMSLVFQVSMVFVFVAALDLFYQWFYYEKQIRMSKQEVKEEYKQLEGDPKVKGKIKERQRRMAMSRMMQAVPTADVVIRNPTHYAVALKYDLDADNAPRVVAKGQDLVALRIVKTAEENGVYVTEEPVLARAIFAASDLGEEIPIEFYRAVAELLAFVYRLREKRV